MFTDHLFKVSFTNKPESVHLKIISMSLVRKFLPGFHTQIIEFSPNDLCNRNRPHLWSSYNISGFNNRSYFSVFLLFLVITNKAQRQFPSPFALHEHCVFYITWLIVKLRRNFWRKKKKTCRVRECSPDLCFFLLPLANSYSNQDHFMETEQVDSL